MADQAPKSIFKSAPMTRRKIDREDKLAKYRADMAGEGQYVFQNNTKGDLYLPRPTKSGRKSVRLNEQFIGDSYYFQMVRTNELKFVREIAETPNQLITEQPPTVTDKGVVEFVEPKTEQQQESRDVLLNEGPTGRDVLLNEGPVDGIRILS